MKTTEKQKLSSKSTSNNANFNGLPQATKRNALSLNLIHALVIHGMTTELYKHSNDLQFKNLLLEIIYAHELVINESKNDELKQKLNYSPLKSQKNETKNKKSPTVNSKKPKKQSKKQKNVSPN